MAEFHTRLREIRMANKITMQQTADMLGIRLRSYQYYEQGRSEPPIEKLKLLADYFHVTVDYLIGRTDS